MTEQRSFTSRKGKFVLVWPDLESHHRRGTHGSVTATRQFGSVKQRGRTTRRVRAFFHRQLLIFLLTLSAQNILVFQKLTRVMAKLADDVEAELQRRMDA